jgi:hypothetical protein
MTHVPSLSPRTLIAMTKHAVTPPQDSANGHPDESIPLSEILLDVLQMPAPAPSWAVEMRRGLSAEDALSILDVYAGWLEVHAENKAGLNGWDGSGSDITLTNVPKLDSVSLPYQSIEYSAKTSVFS